MGNFDAIIKTINLLNEKDKKQSEEELKREKRLGLIKSGIENLVEEGRDSVDISVNTIKTSAGYTWNVKIYGREVILISDELMREVKDKELYIDYRALAATFINKKLQDQLNSKHSS
ncbi:hypothetical protein [Paenibacillus amylolyticus]|uniref:Flagellar hook-associated protein, FliD n=1 Tax=Paenibacillus amylolyticus TaxID=1451 RepID=A0A100VTD5_PAEAM|nr:hypothetical protein [Paenibacillus amylolyticus]UOK62844.1 hypothetical protein MT997_32725 [Paenibacillus sp. OVF10]GAS85645.1 flagellar hook-associated protein, FliD [Paenibacillus amylolyticus]